MKMTVIIKHECNCKEVGIHTLEQGDTFLYKDKLYQLKGRGFRTPHTHADYFVATDLKTGVGDKISMYANVEPVDIEITVVRK